MRVGVACGDDMVGLGLGADVSVLGGKREKSKCSPGELPGRPVAKVTVWQVEVGMRDGVAFLRVGVHCAAGHPESRRL